MSEFVLNTSAHTHCVVHVGSLLEFSGSGEGLFPVLAAFGAMFRSSNPADVVLFVVVASFLSFCFRNNLHAVVVDEDIRCASLHFICRDGGFERHNSGIDDCPEPFLVHGHLNCHVGQNVGCDAWRADARKES